MDDFDINPELMQKRLHTGHWFRSPVFSALLALAILLGKALVYHRAPGRTVLFDALLLIPVSMFAYYEGLVTGMVAGLVVSAADLVICAQAAGVLVPVYLASPVLRSILITRLFSHEVVAMVVAVLSYRARRERQRAEEQIERFLEKIHLLRKHNEAIEQDARDKQAEFERSLLKYSSLLYLLEESAQKIYSNLDAERLFQSLFRVLEECFGSTCASVYLKDEQKGAYFLAHAHDPEDRSGEVIPMILPPTDYAVMELERAHRPIVWSDERHREELQQRGRPAPAVISNTLVDKGRVVGIVHVHAVDRDTSPDPMLMGMVCNIASIALANARLFGEVQWMAERDPLTRLHNRRAFHAKLAAQIEASAHTGEPFALLMLDIDHFKSFNDTYGHQAGDAVLQWFARRCEEYAGAPNSVYRYGGEEFTIIMPHANARAALELAESIRTRINEATFRYKGVDLHVRLSCGVAVYPRNGVESDDLVRKADRALYRAKGAGRDTVALADAGPGRDSGIVPYEVRMAAASKRPPETEPPDPGAPSPPVL